MKRIFMAGISLCLMLGIMFGAVPVEASPATIVVPDDQPTIQQAIDAANSGDTVYVRAGTYYEHVTIGKSLTLQGEDKDTTVIDGGCSGSVIYITSSYVTVSGLTVANGEYGINLIADWVIHHITIRDVIITLNKEIAFYAMHSSGYHLIEDCIISNNGRDACLAHQIGNSIIRNCEVFGNGAGLNVGWGSGTLITNNKVHDNDNFGIAFDSMSNSIIEKNLVYNNLGVGIYVVYVAKYNTIRDNIVHDNLVGIEMNYPPVIGNKVYHNDIIDNTLQVRELGSNIWDNGYPSGGNYWSDYAGIDTNGDGIGDTPYTFPGGQDNYPLMEALKCVTTATGTGEAWFMPSHGTIEDLEALPAIPPGAPAGIMFPHGMFSFKITGLSSGQEVTITVRLPEPVPVGTKWWKCQAGVWYSMSIGDDDGDEVITVTLKDGGQGDGDNIAGQITDDGGPGYPSAVVGWETYPINKVRMLLPWIASIAAIIAAVSLLVLRRRGRGPEYT